MSLVYMVVNVYPMTLMKTSDAYASLDSQENDVKSVKLPKNGTITIQTLCLILNTFKSKINVA